MDKNEIRDQMIDSIVNFIYPKGRHINYQYLLRHIMNEYKLQLGENEWRVFYNSLMEDLQNCGETALLVKNGSLIGLTDFGRRIGAMGGYIAYKKDIERQQSIKHVKTSILYGYYVIGIIGILLANGIIHFSQRYELEVPPFWFAFFWALTGGLVRDLLPRLSKHIARLFQSSK